MIRGLTHLLLEHPALPKRSCQACYNDDEGDSMIQTIEATIDESGHVRLLEAVRLPTRRRALVTILEEECDDLAPPQTLAQMAAAHHARSQRMRAGEGAYVSVDLPFVDDGADW